jgi:hypothetical protein
MPGCDPADVMDGFSGEMEIPQGVIMENSGK